MKCIYSTVFEQKVMSFDIVAIVEKARERINNFSKRSKFVDKDNMTYTVTEYGSCVVWYGGRINKMLEVYENGTFNILNDSKPNLKFVE